MAVIIKELALVAHLLDCPVVLHLPSSSTALAAAQWLNTLSSTCSDSAVTGDRLGLTVDMVMC